MIMVLFYVTNFYCRLYGDGKDPWRDYKFWLQHNSNGLSKAWSLIPHQPHKSQETVHSLGNTFEFGGLIF